MLAEAKENSFVDKSDVCKWKHWKNYGSFDATCGDMKASPSCKCVNGFPVKHFCTAASQIL